MDQSRFPVAPPSERMIAAPAAEQTVCGKEHGANQLESVLGEHGPLDVSKRRFTDKGSWSDKVFGSKYRRELWIEEFGSAKDGKLWLSGRSPEGEDFVARLCADSAPRIARGFALEISEAQPGKFALEAFETQSGKEDRMRGVERALDRFFEKDGEIGPVLDHIVKRFLGACRDTSVFRGVWEFGFAVQLTSESCAISVRSVFWHGRERK